MADKEGNTSEGSEPKDETEVEDDFSSKLAFHADPDKLNEDGKSRNKFARKMNRNESEKLRRDRLNAYIGELAKLVPLILTANKKMDKSSVLRLSVNYLRMYHDLAKNPQFRRQWKPEFLNAENLGNMLLESTGGFLMVISSRGTLTFCTDAITHQLGHSLVDVLGNPIYNIIHPEDHDILQRQFYHVNGQPASAYTLNLERMLPRSGARSFYLRFLDNSSKQNNKYQQVHIVAHLKGVPPVNTQPELVHLNEPDICLVGVGRVDVRDSPKELMPIMNDNNDQWLTRHEMDGTLTFSDPRCATISGFMPEETNGMSPYVLLHKDDVAIVVAAHNAFISEGPPPVTCFRMYTKSQDLIYVRTRTHLVLDMWTSKPRYIVSINDVLSEEEGETVLAECRDKMSQMIGAAGLLSLESPPPELASLNEQPDQDDETRSCPRSPEVPDVLLEKDTQVSIFVEKTRCYKVNLAKGEQYDVRKASPQRTENLYFDPYAPTPTVDTSGPATTTAILSPKPVFLGTLRSRVGTGESRSRNTSVSSSVASQNRNQGLHSPGGSCDMLPDSVTSPGSNGGRMEGSPPSAAGGVTPPQPPPSANPTMLLQHFNKRMAAAPPQFQPLPPDPGNCYTEGHAGSHNSYGRRWVVEGSPVSHASPLLVQMLRQRPLADLSYSDMAKILSEVPGSELWRQARLQRALWGDTNGVGRHMGGHAGQFPYTQADAQASTAWQKYSEHNLDQAAQRMFEVDGTSPLQSSPPSLHSQLSCHTSSSCTQSPQAYPCPDTGSLLQHNKQEPVSTSYTSNQYPQSYQRQDPVSTGQYQQLHYSCGYPGGMTTGSDYPGVASTGSDYTGVISTGSDYPGVASTGSDYSGGGTTCADYSRGSSTCSPPGLVACSPPDGSSAVGQQQDSQLKSQLELLKDIEARREAHARALQALTQEYELQVKQLADDKRGGPHRPTANSGGQTGVHSGALTSALGSGQSGAHTCGVHSGTYSAVHSGANTGNHCAAHTGVHSGTHTGAHSSLLSGAQGSVGNGSVMPGLQHLTRSTGDTHYQDAIAKQQHYLNTRVPSDEKGQYAFHQRGVDNNALIASSEQGYSASDAQAYYQTSTQSQNDTGSSFTQISNTFTTPHSTSNQIDHQSAFDATLDDLLDPSLLESGLCPGDLIGDSELEMYNSLWSSSITAGDTAKLPRGTEHSTTGSNLSGESPHMVRNLSKAATQAPSSVSTSSAYMPRNSGASTSLDMQKLLMKVKDANLSREQCLRLLAQLNSTSKSASGGKIEQQDCRVPGLDSQAPGQVSPVTDPK